MKRMKPYSVLLLYPDYVSDRFGQETYYDHVTAPSVDAAIQKARENCVKLNEWTEDDVEGLEDFFCLLVTEGHHKGVA